MFTQLEKRLMQKNEKKCIFVLDGEDTPCYTAVVTCERCERTEGEEMSPSKRARDKRDLHIYIPVELYKKFKKKADVSKMSMVELLTLYIIRETQNIKLTDEDYEEISKWLQR